MMECVDPEDGRVYLPREPDPRAVPEVLHVQLVDDAERRAWWRGFWLGFGSTIVPVLVLAWVAAAWWPR